MTEGVEFDRWTCVEILSEHASLEIFESLPKDDVSRSIATLVYVLDTSIEPTHFLTLEDRETRIHGRPGY